MIDIMDIIRLNKEVFQDTLRMCSENETIKRAVMRSISTQFIVKESEEISIAGCQKRDRGCDIRVSKERTLEAAGRYIGRKTCVLNFANAHFPGGGVEDGCTAQEESICRCSSLFPCLNDESMLKRYYSEHMRDLSAEYYGDIIYTPGVKVFKTDTLSPETMVESDWFDVDVITCAAPDLRDKEIDDDRLESIHEILWERIMKTAIKKGAEVLILGAFGCGAFMNDPDIVSRVASDVVNKYRDYLDEVVFAIYGRNDYNYRVFEERLKNTAP